MFKTILIIGLVISAISHIVKIVAALSKAAQQNVHWTVAIESLEDSPWATGTRNGEVILPTRNSQ